MRKRIGHEIGKKGLQTTQGPPQEVSRRPRTLQGFEVGANLAPRGVPKSIQNRSKSELASPQDPRPETPPRFQNGPQNGFQIVAKPTSKSIQNSFNTDAKRRHSPTLEKALCHAPFLAYGILGRSPCHPAAAEGAKLSKITWPGCCNLARSMSAGQTAMAMAMILAGAMDMAFAVTMAQTMAVIRPITKATAWPD